ncbi:MAG: hypothetical protein NMK33_02115 [Candidatus Cardinium sp.]|uniref:hypothetical protein n=1 Tax=Cardinium endosymbiont of Dermatophagoides farinae TaxID=2597823 RepID=UPI00118373A1|nr:hypothetical protein [Cardinium endosymbiont of Dermatophagoides farinae]TSJ81278.1 hypothetical protein FPG78_04790 [Cardinium endosymbiont of Dermatophagoides farinae]UWW97336.1 MAG: hypothetical protein NMK33_02115 [Candidatus Cardinium sp.]
MRIAISKIRPSSKPICDQQFLGEAQSSTAAYYVFEEHRQASTPKLPLEIGFAEGLLKNHNLHIGNNFLRI